MLHASARVAGRGEVAVNEYGCPTISTDIGISESVRRLYPDGYLETIGRDILNPNTPIFYDYSARGLLETSGGYGFASSNLSKSTVVDVEFILRDKKGQIIGSTEVQLGANCTT
jgi:hypothetical protein